MILLAFLVTGFLFLYFKAFRNASLEGVVNAPKYVVRAPIEGIFHVEGLTIGTPLAAGAAIGTITNDRLDDRLEAELLTKVSRLMREMAAQEVIRNEITAIRERLATRLDDLREINIRKYEQVTDETMDRAARLQIIADSSHQDLQRFAILARAGVEAPVRIEEYRRAFIEDESESRTAARVASHRLIDKEAAQRDTFWVMLSGTSLTPSNAWTRLISYHSIYDPARKFSTRNSQKPTDALHGRKADSGSCGRSLFIRNLPRS